jgi:hypothetical protein
MMSRATSALRHIFTKNSLPITWLPSLGDPSFSCFGDISAAGLLANEERLLRAMLGIVVHDDDDLAVSP